MWLYLAKCSNGLIVVVLVIHICLNTSNVLQSNQILVSEYKRIYTYLFTRNNVTKCLSQNVSLIVRTVYVIFLNHYYICDSFKSSNQQDGYVPIQVHDTQSYLRLHFYYVVILRHPATKKDNLAHCIGFQITL